MSEQFMKRDLVRSRWIWALLLVLAIFAAYERVRHAGFIWDDDHHLTHNPAIVGTLGFKSIWLTSAATYYPLTLTSFWIQHAVWGLKPLPYHLVNVMVHAVSALLLWRVLAKLAVPGAWFGAALWALHPVQVESVAWITELKNTQSCLFYLLAILLFLHWREMVARQDGRKAFLVYVLALLSGTAALLTKSSTVMLPVVLGLCWWWRDQRWQWRNVFALIPFLLISLAASLWTIWEQKFHSGAMGADWSQSFAQRLIIAGLDFWFYLGKLIWPCPLIFHYARWEIDASQPLMYVPILAAIGVLLFLWWQRNGRAGPLFFAMAYFVASLFPVLGFFNVYYFRYSFVADHFQYLASMGPLALASASVTIAFDSLTKTPLALRLAAYASLLLVLAGVTWRETAQYYDLETLWRSTIAKRPEAWMAHNNLATVLVRTGRVDEAVPHLQAALQLEPRAAEPHSSIAAVLLQRGRTEEAIEHLKKALQLNPKEVEAHEELGTALLHTGRSDEALAHYRSAIEIRPYEAQAYSYLGGALLELGRIDEAVSNFDRAIKLDPANSQANSNLGAIYLQEARLNEAVFHLEKAVEGDPNSSDAQSNLGNALLQLGRLDESARHLEKALEINPGYAAAHFNLANTLLALGRADQAVFHLEKILEMDPQDVDACDNLAWLLATTPDANVRNGARAVELAERASRSANGTNAAHQRALAAAYAEVGRFTDAVRTAEIAIQLAVASNRGALANEIRSQLVLYRANQPFRERLGATRGASP